MSEATKEMFWLVLNRGLDVTFDGVWDWYRERRLGDESYDVVRDHLIVVSQELDNIVRSTLPDQKAYYAQLALDRITRLDDFIEKSVQR